MSEELEALRELCKSSHCVSKILRKKLKPYEVTERKNIIYQALQELETLKTNNRNAYKEGYEQGRFDEKMVCIDNTPPTAEEVCKALSEYLGEPILYNSGTFYNQRETSLVCKRDYASRVYIVEKLPLHLITIIVKFYESEVKKDE